jgi:phosphotriesterase-related protein
MTVNTTGGAVPVESLGRTLIHEHVLIGFPGWWMDGRKQPYRRADVVSRVVDAFQQVRAHSVETIVDPCPIDLGRDIELIAGVAQRSGVKLICATGVYVERMGIPWTFRFLPEEEITDIFIKEIEIGIGNTGIKAGVVKIATDSPVTDYEKKMVSAAAKAAKATGVPIISHTEKCSCGQDQIDIVTSCGCKPNHLLVGHSDGRDDPEYQASLAERGAYVGFDRFGQELFNTDEVRVRCLMNMVQKGHIDRIMVSHDMVHCFGGDLVPGFLDNTVEALHKIMPSWRMTHLFENILPRLKSAGLSDQEFDHIIRENPRRFFAEAIARA